MKCFVEGQDRHQRILLPEQLDDCVADSNSVRASQIIMERLMQFIHENALPTAYVSLMADHGTPDFYKRYGFEVLLPPKKPACFYALFNALSERKSAAGQKQSFAFVYSFL